MGVLCGDITIRYVFPGGHDLHTMCIYIHVYIIILYRVVHPMFLVCTACIHCHGKVYQVYVYTHMNTHTRDVVAQQTYLYIVSVVVCFVRTWLLCTVFWKGVHVRLVLCIIC